MTVSHLRFGPKPLTSSYLVNEADYLGVHLQSYLSKYDCLTRLKPGGVLVLNATWKSAEVSNVERTRRVQCSWSRLCSSQTQTLDRCQTQNAGQVGCASTAYWLLLPW